VVTTWLPETLGSVSPPVNASAQGAIERHDGFALDGLAGRVLATLRRGAVIPAHPLALDAGRKLDVRRQRALSRYYLDAGAGGLAVGVHTTQFAIRDVGSTGRCSSSRCAPRATGPKRPPVMIAGLAGRTAQALSEAQVARDLGYHAGLLSLAAMKGASEDELIAHARAVARESRWSVLSAARGRRHRAAGLVLAPFRAIENVVAIKIAPFNRYRTLDVIRGVVEAGARPHHALHRQ
jgi:dihydrodipicolinate synthase/N-acetylneuraminate lyase